MKDVNFKGIFYGKKKGNPYGLPLTHYRICTIIGSSVAYPQAYTTNHHLCLYHNCGSYIG